MFPQQTSEAIIRTPISVVNKKDCLYWPRKEDGIYSIRTGYYAAKEDYLARNKRNPSTSTDKRDLWREIWKMEVLQKIKMHLWKIIDSLLCQIFLNENESVEHALLLCEWVRAVWFGAECQCTPITRTVSSLENWLMKNIKKIRDEGGEDQGRRMKKRAKTRIGEIRRRNANLVRWRPPPNDWLKANVDATFKKESDNGTISVVVRDKERKLKPIAIRQALIIVNNLQLGRTLIESNNKKLVQTIKSKSSIGRAWAIIQDIQILLEALPEKGLTWTLRDDNLLAHAVAKAAEVGTLYLNWSLQPPAEIHNII
ncbi:hypothetical protein Ahy_B01g056357 [Arachis hypogaea]|uniref:RNase H type-1 domain-containing protein n=1 Tax=Arachis hypogaea TaxID=3818 RepID=A0A445AYP7_ARAHY|nr:hypothetical protein Ahy_B01g056357 [Arachis hypogaea]